MDVLPEDMDDEDDESPEMIFEQERHRILQRRQMEASQNEPLILPLPVPPPKENDDKEK